MGSPVGFVVGIVVGAVLVDGEALGKYFCVGLTDIDGNRLGS